MYKIYKETKQPKDKQKAIGSYLKLLNIKYIKLVPVTIHRVNKEESSKLLFYFGYFLEVTFFIKYMNKN
jgi:pullulanase/glycogen debranching enzyme